MSSDAVEAAMASVDRRLFVPPDLQSEAYRDHPLPIGHGATISAPHMHAHCLELALPVLPDSGARILDVGSGSGYLSAVLARLWPGARIIGVEYVPELVADSKANLRKDAGLASLLDDGTIELRCGDGWAGAPDAAPFHYIHVGAAAERVPEALVEQLAPGGRLVVPVGPRFAQSLVQVDKAADGRITKKDLAGVMYVPLVQVDGKPAPPAKASAAGAGSSAGAFGGSGAASSSSGQPGARVA